MAFHSTFASVRALSTSAARNQLVKPPVQVFGLEGRYATALYSAATKEKQLQAVEKELLKFQEIFKTDQRLQEFFLNPVIKKNLKVAAIEDISKKISLTKVTSNLLGLLAENNRLKNFNGIVNSFEIIMSAYRGDLPCEVTSAKPLEESVKQELTATLGKFAKKGEKVSIKYIVNPTIVGGLIVSIGDKYVDMSIANKIKKYSDILQSA